MQIFTLWLAYVATMVIAGWTLSGCEAYTYMGITGGIVAFACTGYGFGSWRRTPENIRKEFLGDLTSPPFLVLLGLISLAGVLYRTTVIDSLSYRIPRMLMWLQEGRVHFIDSPDARLNFMTPVWEFATTPLFQAFGFQFLWVGSALCWVILYLAFIAILSEFSVIRHMCRWLAIIPCSASCFSLQAASTMNDGWAAAFLAISLAFILSYRKRPGFTSVVTSGLALALAANAKPHFAVFALPWLLWFFFSPWQPWRSIRWKWFIPVVLLVLVCSPLPTFVNNSIHYGNFKGAAGDGGFGLAAWYVNLGLGSLMMLWQMVQPPVNPTAGMVNRVLAERVGESSLSDIAPRFKLAGSELAIVDNASLGLFVSLILAAGIVIAARRKAILPCWIWWSLASFAVCFGIAVSQVVPGTLGRSFSGFLVLAMPAALAGISTLGSRTIKAIALIPVAFSALAISISPSHPLWPAKTFGERYPQVAGKMARYFQFQDRSYAGHTLVAGIPPDVRTIGILAVGDQSLIELWGPDMMRHVRFFPSGATLSDLKDSGIQWFVTAAANPAAPDTLYGALVADISNSPDFREVHSDRFICVNSRGAELWRLYRHAPSSSSPPAE